ncbi:MAG: CRISPR-associated protein Csx20 [Sulfurimonas sp.]|nr:CRISPR-associated protein Csx20 [Sulfurimonas sp.]
MQKLHLLFNHTLTPEQLSDAKVSLSCDIIIALPQELQELWSSVPPDLKSLKEYLNPIKEHLGATVIKDDFVLVQGDFGATCIMVNFVKELGAKPVYATTSRDVVEAKEGDKVIKKSIFRHKQFREYE